MDADGEADVMAVRHRVGFFAIAVEHGRHQFLIGDRVGDELADAQAMVESVGHHVGREINAVAAGGDGDTGLFRHRLQHHEAVIDRSHQFIGRIEAGSAAGRGDHFAGNVAIARKGVARGGETVGQGHAGKSRLADGLHVRDGLVGLQVTRLTGCGHV